MTDPSSHVSPAVHPMVVAYANDLITTDEYYTWLRQQARERAAADVDRRYARKLAELASREDHLEQRTHTGLSALLHRLRLR